MPPNLRLGDIEFLNSWPVTYALAQGIIPAPVTLVRGAPTALNAQLAAGALDASAVSALAYLRHADEWSLLPSVAIGSESGVNSVLLISRLPLRELDGQTIAVTDAGATTPMLLRILLGQAQGVRAEYVTTSTPFPDVLQAYPAALAIGDDALRALPAARDDYFTWDLGAWWRDWTGLPMVYAVWAARRDVIARAPEAIGRLREALLASKAWGLAHLDAVSRAAAARTGFPEPVVRDYFRGIRYELDEAAQAGLQRYAECVGLTRSLSPLRGEGR
ncbi:MAG: menaquinone biosynthesis protein [Candidatus Omnitrophica bacterium]|nr:menaquinone biosynthesis protein [Candidatus Omnitrophota bacterium]